MADNSADSLLMLDESLTMRQGRNASGEHQLPIIKQMDNVTPLTRIEVSSQQNLIGCLTDGSPETFWESGDEVCLFFFK